MEWCARVSSRYECMRCGNVMWSYKCSNICNLTSTKVIKRCTTMTGGKDKLNAMYA
jgi:hypothetical protein